MVLNMFKSHLSRLRYECLTIPTLFLLKLIPTIFQVDVGLSDVGALWTASGALQLSALQGGPSGHVSNAMGKYYAIMVYVQYFLFVYSWLYFIHDIWCVYIYIYIKTHIDIIDVIYYVSLWFKDIYRTQCLNIPMTDPCMPYERIHIYHQQKPPQVFDVSINVCHIDPSWDIWDVEKNELRSCPGHPHGPFAPCSNGSNGSNGMGEMGMKLGLDWKILADFECDLMMISWDFMGWDLREVEWDLVGFKGI